MLIRSNPIRVSQCSVWNNMINKNQPIQRYALFSYKCSNIYHQPLLVRNKTQTLHEMTAEHMHSLLMHTSTSYTHLHRPESFIVLTLTGAACDWCWLLLLGRLGDHQTKRDGLCALFPCVFVCVCV